MSAWSGAAMLLLSPNAMTSTRTPVPRRCALSSRLRWFALCAGTNTAKRVTVREDISVRKSADKPAGDVGAHQLRHYFKVLSVFLKAIVKTLGT